MVQGRTTLRNNLGSGLPHCMLARTGRRHTLRPNAIRPRGCRPVCLLPRRLSHRRKDPASETPKPGPSRLLYIQVAEHHVSQVAAQAHGRQTPNSNPNPGLHGRRHVRLQLKVAEHLALQVAAVAHGRQTLSAQP